jgi:signal peptidase I
VKRSSLRSKVSAAALIVLAIVAWVYLAPTQIGGSTSYVVTRGISMEPRFHTGDLAIVRPTDDYKVGEIVAYHSTLLHTVVLHRIIAIDGNRYVFKGDNNNFIDPTRPTRSLLIGALWLHVPRGGLVLDFVHTPVVAATLCGGLGLILLFGFREKRRRRSRRRKGATGSGPQGTAVVNTQEHGVARPVNFGALLTTSAAAAVVFVVLALIAFTRPVDKPTTAATSYTQRVTFGYSASAPAGPVYPDGIVKTGDPIFLDLVHQLAVKVDYTLTTSASHSVSGTERVLLRLTGPTGWTRSIILAPATKFTGDHTSTDVALDIPRVQSLLDQVQKLTGIPAMSGYTIAVVPQVHIKATVAGQPVKTSYDPALSFGLGPLQLEPGSSAAGSGSQSGGGVRQSRNGSVSSASKTSNTLNVLGVSPSVEMLRWSSLLGLVLAGVGVLLTFLLKRSEPFEETVRIQAQYGHMIVPIVGGEDLGWPPVDVPTINALVRLAESSDRLILHNRSDNIDTYLLNDEGTVYRYQVRPAKVVWGEWTQAQAETSEASTPEAGPEMPEAAAA